MAGAGAEPGVREITRQGPGCAAPWSLLPLFAVCTANACRLGIGNFRCVHVPAGQPLPFPDNTFDGVLAASVVEQTPDPRATLRTESRSARAPSRRRGWRAPARP